MQTRTWRHRWRSDVELFVRCCEKCSSYHRNRPPKQGLLQPMIVAEPVSRFSIDFSGAYPTSNNNKYILSAICPFTKFAVTEAIPDKIAATVAKVIVIKIILVASHPALMYLTPVCRHFVPRYCSLGSDTWSHGAGGATAVVEL